MTHFRRIALVGVTVALTVALAGCTSGDAGPAPVATTSAAPTPATKTTAAPEATPTGTAASPTCDTLISDSLDAQLREQGWTFQEAPMYIDTTEVKGGLVCNWGNYSAPTNDNVQMWGWATIDSATAATLEKALEGQRWERIEGDHGELFYTQPKDTITIKDEDGYGMTYQFGDGWLKFADTKQGLLLIAWPR
ncbi:DUF3558 domain-containing protein [Microbacterium gorillae]|uniref:DUF3558 domain-containing protein n=1 Tax=Microbacterium gorillae TaxID=1231063 RepID=UPI000590EC3D|nr:DUF3558 domain-containing protein [Microbacterium gorillae]